MALMSAVTVFYCTQLPNVRRQEPPLGVFACRHQSAPGFLQFLWKSYTIHLGRKAALIKSYNWSYRFRSAEKPPI